MRFVDTYVDREKRFSVGREITSGRYYVAIPVANRVVDYEEYYEISSAMHDAYPSNLAEVIAFANRCRTQACDDKLFIQAGADRGVG